MMNQQTGTPKLTGTRTAGRKNLILFLVFILAMSAAAGAAWWFYFKKPDVDPEVSKNLVKARVGRAEISVVATGIVKPVQEVKISPKQTGLLMRLLVKQGDRVKQGQILAYMDDSNLRGQVEAARGAYNAAMDNYEKLRSGNRPQEVAQAKFNELKGGRVVQQAQENINRLGAQLEALKAQLKRDESFAHRQGMLSGAGAVSEQAKIDAETAAQVTRSQLHALEMELQQAVQSKAQSQAELSVIQEQHDMAKAGFRKEEIAGAWHNAQQAKGQLIYNQSLLNDTVIRAPFAGVITQKYADAGAIVTPTTSAATTSATSSSIVALAGRLEMVAQVSEANISKISIGQQVDITAAAYSGEVFHGRVTQIAPAAIVTSNVTTFEVHADILDDVKNKLLAGMNVSTKFNVGELKDAILVPTVCVISRRGQTGVYVPNEKNEPVFKSVKTGPTVGRDTVITEGLKGDDTLFQGLSREHLSKEGYGQRGGQQPGGLRVPGAGRGFGGGGGGGGGRRGGGF